MEQKRLKTDHVQPKNPLFTSDSKHPPRSRHAAHLGDQLEGITIPTQMLIPFMESIRILF